MTPHSALQGMSIAVLGPTFPNLAANVGKNVSDIYYIFVGRSLGYLGGSVVGGVLFDCMNATLLLGECCPAGHSPGQLLLLHSQRRPGGRCVAFTGRGRAPGTGGSVGCGAIPPRSPLLCCSLSPCPAVPDC